MPWRLMQTLRPIPVQLKAICWGSAMRLFLKSVEVWAGPTYLGELSAEWLQAQVAKELHALAALRRLEVELYPNPLPVPPARRLGPTAAPTQAVREHRRTRRRARRARPRKHP